MINYKKYIEDIPDFPKQGIVYRDIQPLLSNPIAFSCAITDLCRFPNLDEVDYFVGVESRGFLFAAALAHKTLKGLKMIRKAGKLPNSNVNSIQYDLEYGSAEIEIKPGEGNIVLVDDVYATGGTLEAAEELCKISGYKVVDKICLVDIGIKEIHDVKCLIHY